MINNCSDGVERATLSASWDIAPASKGSRIEDQLSIEAREGKSSGQVTREEEREKGPIFGVEEVGQPRVLSLESCAMNS